MSLNYKLVPALFAVSACAESAIDVVLSGDKPNNLDTTCVTAVAMKVFGENYESDRGDFTYACRQITGGVATVVEVKKQFAGLFELDIPRSGLGGAQFEAFSGACPTTIPTNIRPNDLVFTASARYDGEGSLVMPIEPVASCVSTPSISVRAIDVLKLTTTKDCALSVFADTTASGAGVAYGQIAPTLFDGPTMWSPRPYGDFRTGVGSAPGLLSVSNYGCLMADVGTNTTYSVSCLDTTPAASRKMVCATGTELEVGVAPVDSALALIDLQKFRQWRGVVIGSVWSGSGAVS